jgi:hypothetical protein
MKNRFFSFLLAICALSSPSQAGVFNIPEFVEYKSWAVGLEPELTLSTYGNTGESGIGFNAKFTYGFSPLSNLQFGIGNGSGSKGFRLGGTYSFDFIPDLQGQLGFGVAAQAYYIKLKDSTAQTEFTAYPYLHKAFPGSNGFVFDPYIALPLGLAFYSGTYRTILQGAFGCTVKTSEHFRVNGELGLSFKETDSYLAFGVTYRD